MEIIYDMLWWFFSLLFNGYTLEFVVYMIIDKFIKDRLKDANTPNEKQKAWLDECAILSILSLFFWFHHVPYIILLMIFCTIISTAIIEGTNLRVLFCWVVDCYKDFREHEDSMSRRKDNGSWMERFINLVHPKADKENHLPPPNVAVKMYMPGNNFETTFVPDVRTQKESQVTKSDIGELRMRHPVLSTHLLDDFPQDSNVKSSYSSESCLRPWVQQPQSSLARRNPLLSLQLKTNFQPRGLVNNKENLCFFNCVIQVLARTESLLSELIKISAHLRLEDPVLVEAVNVFATLTNPDLAAANLNFQANKASAPLDTSKLRKALVLAFKNSLIAKGIRNRPSEDCLLQLPSLGFQKEQDVAEFLMWILERLHKSLACRKVAREMRMKSIHRQEYLNLWRKYDSPDLHTIKQLKQFHQCQVMESKENLLSQSSRQHEAVIADLDWLLYKCPENVDDGPSLVDDIFTGQFMFINSCHTYGQVSVGTDVFRILPVALPQDHKSTSIQECLQHLTVTEVVNSWSALPCNFCSTSTPVSKQISSSPKHGTWPPSLQNESVLDFLSPIRKDSESHEPNYKSVSPILNTSFSCDRQTVVSRLPHCLVIQLMRFRVQSQNIHSRSNQPFRLCNRVKIEATPINMEACLTGRSMPFTQQQYMYSLYAIILHSSSPGARSISEGHYIALVKTGCDCWHLFNDEDVLAIPDIGRYLEQQSVEQNAYLLFYSRISKNT